MGRWELNMQPRVPDNIRIYAIGDIHGRLDLLEAMQKKITGDAIDAGNLQIVQIFLGDYVDRGPNSKGVIDWLLEPPPIGWQRICLKGNHEAHVLNFLKTPDIIRHWQRYGGLENLQSYGVDLISLQSENAPDILMRDYSEKFPLAHFEFFSNLPLFVEFGDYFFVHAGVRPGKPLNKQKEEDLTWIRDEFLSSQMDFGKVIVHGHTPTENPEILTNRINIDTRAYDTGRLTCLVLEKENHRFL
jgi:serine/threonine protein phosphatase 1